MHRTGLRRDGGRTRAPRNLGGIDGMNRGDLSVATAVGWATYRGFAPIDLFLLRIFVPPGHCRASDRFRPPAAALEEPVMMGRCPEVEVLIRGRTMPRVLDTGSQVALFSQSFQRHFGNEELQNAEDLQWLTLNAANGLRIPFVGYVVLDFNVGGIEFPGRAVLIVEDRCMSSDNGLLGMNVISECWESITRKKSLGKTAFKSRVPLKA